MRLEPTPLSGCFTVELDPSDDERGFFARVFDSDVFRSAGLNGEVAQCSISYNRKSGTVRGLHLQTGAGSETKVVRCISGAIFDVAVDVRPASIHYRRWFGIELSAKNRRGLVIGPGLAHGFCTLTDDAEIYYQISARYDPAVGVGIRWDDPDIGIDWPRAAGAVVSDRDLALPYLRDIHRDLRLDD